MLSAKSPTVVLDKTKVGDQKYCSESSGDSRNGFPNLELGIMSHVPHRNPAELRAARHRGARRSAARLGNQFLLSPELSEQYFWSPTFVLPKTTDCCLGQNKSGRVAEHTSAALKSLQVRGAQKAITIR